MFNEAIKVIKSRRSVRKYIDKEIPEEVLREIVDCARLAPSGNNRQPWAFLVITDQDKKEKIASLARYGKFIKEAGACIGVFIDESADNHTLVGCSSCYRKYNPGCHCTGTGYLLRVPSYKRDHSEEVKKMVNCPPNMELAALSL